MADITPGSQTSEFQLAKYVSTILAIVALLSTVATAVLGSGLLHENTIAYAVITGVISVSAMVLKVATSLGYASNRTELKIADLKSDAAMVMASAAKPAAAAAPAAAPAPAPAAPSPQ